MSGLVTISSEFSVDETVDRLISVIESNRMTIFARVDHSQNAIKVGLPLLPTQLILFGNPKAGTILMQDQRTSGLDLPVKALVWEDEAQKVWLTYNDAHWIAERHGLSDASKAMVEAIDQGMKMVTSSSVRD